eukprot:80698-Chlamydomonas_euryale.AAC.1
MTQALWRVFGTSWLRSSRCWTRRSRARRFPRGRRSGSRCAQPAHAEGCSWIVSRPATGLT